MTVTEAVDILQASNRKIPIAELTMYAEAFLERLVATANLEKNGLICFHPRTGSPFENPFQAVRARCDRVLRSLPRVKSDKLWSASGVAPGVSRG